MTASHNVNSTSKNIMIMLGLICMFNFIPFAFAQNQNSLFNEDQERFKKIDTLDNLLSSTMAATLTGLTLTGASFLARISEKEHEVNPIDIARRFLIKGFLFFLACLIAILIFDIAELLFESNLNIRILDIFITYILFGIGIIYLVKGAIGIYSSFVRKK